MSDSIVYRKDVVEALYQALRTQLQGTFTDSMSLAISMAKALPSVEPKTGKWKPWKAYYGKDHKSWSDELKCSECGYKWGDEEYKFCPMCGAKMEGEER